MAASLLLAAALFAQTAPLLAQTAPGGAKPPAGPSLPTQKTFTTGTALGSGQGGAGQGGGAGAGQGTGSGGGNTVGSPMGGGSTISGRPPELPLQRVTPRQYDVKFEGSIWAPGVSRGDTAPMQLSAMTVWFPMILQSTWSAVDPASLKPELWIEARKDPKIGDRVQYRQGLPFGLSAMGFPVGDVAGQSLKWNVTWRVQVWSAKLDEAAAARTTWPVDWPAEVQEALRPQPGIESDAPEFKAFVDRVSQGKLRAVSPWIAAKELVRATIKVFRNIDNDGLRVESGFTRGLVLNGALSSMNAASGTAHDMTAACTAVLRAAGIPARAVIGAADLPTSSGNATRTRLISWGEFYLPGAGWVPYDPVDLRGAIRGGLSLDRSWPSFGNWSDLNERIPLSYTWIAPIPGTTSMPYPAVWSWSTHGVINTQVISDMVGIQIVGRGRAKE
ncbi:MAG: transglutaminase-like domain-containing protein [Phycisphaerales bacterium]